jgi:capsular polysaccharide biosynthesis protein
MEKNEMKYGKFFNILMWAFKIIVAAVIIIAIASVIIHFIK